MPEMKRSIKDSVFTLMFKEPGYTLQLYHVLHPEDSGVTEADCKIVTLENVLTVGQYNDLAILVPFLASREKEVRNIMELLFSEETIREIHEYNLVKEAEEKVIRAMVSALKKIALAPAAVAQTLVEQFGLAQDVAEQKVQQYWS